MTERQQTLEQPAREERIRARAHELWEQAGSPSGKADEYWFQAEALIDAEGKREAALDEAVAGSFPASDPPAATQPPSSAAEVHDKDPTAIRDLGGNRAA